MRVDVPTMQFGQCKFTTQDINEMTNSQASGSDTRGRCKTGIYARRAGVSSRDSLTQG